MELRHLRYFLTVSETLNISEAARRLQMTQPALSRQIRELEGEVGFPLFRREQGGLTLTDCGEALRARGRGVVDQVRTMLEDVRGIGARLPVIIRVGYHGFAWSKIVEPVVGRFRREFPKARMLMADDAPSALALALRRDELDLIMLSAITRGLRREFDVRPVASVEARLVLPERHPLAGRRSIALNDLRDETLLTVSESATAGRARAIVQACRVAGFTPRLKADGRSPAMLMDAVGAGRGVGVVAPDAIEDNPSGLHVSKIKAPGVAFDIFAVHRSRAGSAIRRLVDLIGEHNRASA